MGDRRKRGSQARVSDGDEPQDARHPHTGVLVDFIWWYSALTR